MDKNTLRGLAIKYKIDEPLIEKYVKMASQKELNLPLYDIVTLYNLYKEDKYVREHAVKYSYYNKLMDWYDGRKVIVSADAFRPAALHFEKHGIYTLNIKNKHPNSEYSKFWFEEARRCLYGYHTGTDWISGYNYFYLNYSRIISVKTLGSTDSDMIRAERIESFPAMWDSDYYYFHYLEECERLGLHAAVLKARGRGYSFKGGSMLNRNFFLIPKSRSLVLASDKKYLIEDGILNKAWEMMSFLNENTEWAKRTTKKNTDLHKRASVEKIKGGVKTEEGFMSEIMGVSLKDDPDKARGKRSKLILYEEAGSFDNLIHAWIINEASVQQGKRVFGLRVAFGTGGEEGAGFEGLKELFFKPEGNSIYGVPDVWNMNARTNKVAYFVPEYVNLEGHYDNNGNSNMESAKVELEKEREMLLKSNASSMTIARKKAERPMNPHEAVLRTEGSPFPVIDLREHLIDVRTKPIYKGVVSVGNLVLDGDSKVRWIADMTGKLKPIVKLETNESDRQGCIQIFRHPERNELGEVTNGLYIAGTDPIDLDRDEVGNKYSLGSTFVMNALTEQIVAEYTGRPDRADEYYENVRRLCIYFNCQVMYENNLKGLGTYFINKHSEHLLADKPKVLEDTLQYVSKSNRKKGYIASEKVNAYGRELIAKWLTSEWLSENKELQKLNTIISEGLLEELINWYKDGNFDRVSAMIALMIHKADV